MISVAIATYNGEKYILAQINSILEQTISDFEIVVCDDNSSDSTLEILSSLCSKDKRIKLFKNKENLGFKKNFEKIINLCTGDYVAFCDQDDIWLPNHLEFLMSIIGENDLAGANSMLIDSDGNSLGITLLDTKKQERLPKTSDEYIRTICYSNIFQGTASLFRRSFLINNMPIPNNIIYHDWWFAINSALSNSIIYDRNVILLYRQHNNNVTENRKFNAARKILVCLFNKKHKSLVKSHLLSQKNMLFNIKTKTNNIYVDEAYNYYTNLLRKNRLKNIGVFFRNYNYMYCTNKRGILFIMRLFQMLFIG